MLRQIFRSWNLHVVTGGSSSRDLNNILGQLRVPNLLDVALLMSSLPLSELGSGEDVEEGVLIKSDLIH